YEQIFEEDAYGKELGSNARVWRVLLKELEEYNNTVVKSWRVTLDVYLVFTGLFSAVVTTFVVQSSQALQPDHAEINSNLLVELIAIQRAWANNLPVEPSSNHATDIVTASTTKYWANRFWFSSLALSLIAAFMAVLIRQWLQEYERAVSGCAKRRALAWQYRRWAMKHWKVPLLVALLPMLLHFSLIMFLIGLTLYVIDFDTPMAWAIAAFSAVFYSFYVLSTFLSMANPQCPYQTPASHYGYLFYRAISAWIQKKYHDRRSDDPIESNSDQQTPLEKTLGAKDTSKRHVREANDITRRRDELMAKCLAWALKSSSNRSVTAIVVHAASSLPLDPTEKYSGSLRYWVVAWFGTTLTNQRSDLDWKQGRERKLECLACSLLRCSNDELRSYQNCIERVYRALMDAILSKDGDSADSDLPILEGTALALYGQLRPPRTLAKPFPFLATSSRPYPQQDPRNNGLNVFWDGSSLAGPSPPKDLRLQPIVWYHMLRYLTSIDYVAPRNGLHLALCLWRSLDPASRVGPAEKRQTEGAVTLRNLCSNEGRRIRRLAQRAIQSLLCSDSEKSCAENKVTDVDNNDENDDVPSAWTHMLCHAVEAYREQDDTDLRFDVEPDVIEENLAFIAKTFVHFLDSSFAFQSIDTAMLIMRCPGVTQLHRSALVARYREALQLPTAGRLLEPQNVKPLFRLLVSLVRGSKSTNHVDTLRALASLFQLYPDEVFDTIVEDELNLFVILRSSANVAMRDRLSAPHTDALADVLGHYINNAIQRLQALNPNEPAGHRLAGTAQDVVGQIEHFTWCTWTVVLRTTQIGCRSAEAPDLLLEALGSLAQCMPPLARTTWLSSIANTVAHPLPLVLGIALNELRGRRAFGKVLKSMQPIPQPAILPENAANRLLHDAHVRVIKNDANEVNELWCVFTLMSLVYTSLQIHVDAQATLHVECRPSGRRRYCAHIGTRFP
ncbi:hypothetical protein EV121DRAFT_215442, partial [Schizophyllum commune]